MKRFTTVFWCATALLVARTFRLASHDGETRRANALTNKVRSLTGELSTMTSNYHNCDTLAERYYTGYLYERNQSWQNAMKCK